MKFGIHVYKKTLFGRKKVIVENSHIFVYFQDQNFKFLEKNQGTFPKKSIINGLVKRTKFKTSSNLRLMVQAFQKSKFEVSNFLADLYFTDQIYTGLNIPSIYRRNSFLVLLVVLMKTK